MATEIERKFLVKDLEAVRQHSVRSYSISQGYISSGNGRTVRVRGREKVFLRLMFGILVIAAQKLIGIAQSIC